MKDGKNKGEISPWCALRCDFGVSPEERRQFESFTLFSNKDGLLRCRGQAKLSQELHTDLGKKAHDRNKAGNYRL